MKGLPVDQREQIRDAIDIVDLIGRYVPLKRQGRNFVGQCPWHDDRRPSLQVNPERQTFKCWVCNIGGDIFSFIMQAEGVDFREALSILADMAGIELKSESYRKKTDLFFNRTEHFGETEIIIDPESSPFSGQENNSTASANQPGRTNNQPGGTANQPGGTNNQPGGTANQPGGTTPNVFYTPGMQNGANGTGAVVGPGAYIQEPFVPQEITKTVLYRALDWLSSKYHQCFLQDPEAEAARQYIRNRGITDEMIEKFRIGYAPIRPNYLLDLIENDRNRTAVLTEAGVLFRRENYRHPPQKLGTRLTEYEKKDYMDRFRGRVLFPIRDTQNRTVAFGGRVIPNGPLESPAKYVNSPETPLFSKFRMLYGLDLARTSLRKSGQVLITEGYTDCIMAHQFGFTNAVAALGTAVGTGHIKILKRFVDKMILVLDGDTAGKKRAREVLELFVAEGADMSVLTLPNNEDPCDFLLEHGAEEFEKLLQEGTCDAMEHAIQSVLEGVDLQRDIIGTSKALDKIISIIALFPVNSSVSDPIRFRMALTIRRLAERFRISEQEIRNSIREHRARQNRRQYSNEQLEPGHMTRQQNQINSDEDGKPSERDFNTFPIAALAEESDDFLQKIFPMFPKSVWTNSALMPSNLEQGYLEFWLTSPQFFPELMKIVPMELLRSPVTRQLDALGRFLQGNGILPDFSQIIIRYEDRDMKNFLVHIIDETEKKDLEQLLEGNEGRLQLFKMLKDGFEKLKLEIERPQQIGGLKSPELSGEEKLSKLEEIRQQLLRQQQIRSGGTAFTEESGSETE